MVYSDLTAKLAAGGAPLPVGWPRGPIPGLTLGLWRAGGKRGSALGFVFTNPPADTRITAGDSVYVLAVADFADYLDDKNTLSLPDDVMGVENVGASHAWASMADLEQNPVMGASDVWGHEAPTLQPKRDATVEMVAAALKAIDNDGNGTIGLAEYLASGGTEQDFKALDIDGDGEIDASELMAIVHDETLQQTVSKLFDRYDLDGSGTINTMSELQMLTVSTFFALKSSDYPPFEQLSHQARENFADSLAQNIQGPFEWTQQEYIEWFKSELQQLLSQNTNK